MPQQLILDDIDIYSFPRDIQEAIVRIIGINRLTKDRIKSLLLDNNLTIPLVDWLEILKTALALHIISEDIEVLLAEEMTLDVLGLEILPLQANNKFLVIEDFIALKDESRAWVELKKQEWRT